MDQENRNLDTQTKIRIFVTCEGFWKYTKYYVAVGVIGYMKYNTTQCLPWKNECN